MLDKAASNDEQSLRILITGLKGHGTLLLVIDQPATIGALPIQSPVPKTCKWPIRRD